MLIRRLQMSNVPQGWDIIGKVGFNHDFEQGKSQDAKDIQKAWTDQVNAGMTTAAFYVCFCPRSKSLTS